MFVSSVLLVGMFFPVCNGEYLEDHRINLNSLEAKRVGVSHETSVSVFFIENIHPGVGGVGPIEPGSKVATSSFHTAILDAERSPNIGTTNQSAELDGVVILRIPHSDLREGVSINKSISLEGYRSEYNDEIKNNLSIEIELSS
jgi:hypothetical protein